MTEDGHSLMLTLFFLTALAGTSTAVLDVGSWYRAGRELQAEADTAALLAAQALPDSTDAARTVAGADQVSFSTAVVEHDTVTVHAKRRAPGFFAHMFPGLGSGQVEAKAVARAGLPSKARWVAPIGVDVRHPQLSGPGCPCWKQSATLDSSKVGPGAFRLIDLDGKRGATAGTIGTWVRQGFHRYMSLGWYSSETSAKVASPQVRTALSERAGSELLFPIYRETHGSTQTKYRVVGWAGFHLTGYDIHGSKSMLRGWFERVIWEGMQSQTGSENDFGVRTVALIS